MSYDINYQVNKNITSRHQHYYYVFPNAGCMIATLLPPY